MNLFPPNSITPVAQLPYALRLAQLLAASYYSNPRNLEHTWYSFWLLVALQLAKGQKNMVIFPQFYVWLEKNKENVTSKPPKIPTIKAPPLARSSGATTGAQDFGTVRVTRSRTMVAQSVHPSGKDILVEGGDDDLPEPEGIMIEDEPPSPTETVGAADPILRLPDFAVVEVSGETTNSISGSEAQLPKVKKGALQVRLLLENKRFVSRSVSLDTEDKIWAETFATFKGAIEEITKQAACVFSQPMYDSSKEIVGIVTCGDYWYHTIFTRENIDQSVMDLMNTGDGTYQNKKTDERSHWTDPMKIQDQSSMDIL